MTLLEDRPDLGPETALDGLDASDLDPTLLDRLRACSPEEQAMLGAALDRAHRPDSQFDLTTFVHRNLQADVETALAADYRELSTLKAPPTILRHPGAPVIPLPEPLAVDTPLDRTIKARGSRRDFGGPSMTVPELATVLHYAAGVRKTIMAYNTREFPVRYTPNAGGLQSPEVYLVVNRVTDLKRGLYHFVTGDHTLELLNEGNMRRKLVGMSLFQEWMHHLDRLLWKYGPRSYRYAHMDVGYVSAHVYLVTAALRLRTSAVSGFLDDAMNDFLELDGTRRFVQLLMPIGRRPGVADASCALVTAVDEPAETE